MEEPIYLGHHFSKLSNSNFIVGIADIEDMTISPSWIFLDIDIVYVNVSDKKIRAKTASN